MGDMVGLGGGCIATRGHFPSKVWDLSQHTDMCGVKTIMTLGVLTGD